MELQKRTYDLAPELDLPGRTFRCRDCGRDLAPGYPVVPVARSNEHTEPTHEGVGITDFVCVYCDELAAHEDTV